jgi:hypothetical protein
MSADEHRGCHLAGPWSPRELRACSEKPDRAGATLLLSEKAEEDSGAPGGQEPDRCPQGGPGTCREPGAVLMPCLGHGGFRVRPTDSNNAHTS